jgi:hypothetical protein
MPTSASYTFSNAAVDPVINADDAMASMITVQLAASTTFAAGTVLGEITATPGVYKAYASGSSDGSQNPVGILRRAAVTDSSGHITNYDEWQDVGLGAAIFTQGVFRTQDLTGLDANAVSKLGGHLLEGSVTTGLFSF